mmetsp:Transcript_44539/g.92975  ORF Transcript_44539/g.92975 Transcript_44539/m.92975 type:complete len:88 (+) Transcript_44539:994-1257(+)
MFPPVLVYRRERANASNALTHRCALWDPTHGALGARACAWVSVCACACACECARVCVWVRVRGRGSKAPRRQSVPDNGQQSRSVRNG